MHTMIVSYYVIVDFVYEFRIRSEKDKFLWHLSQILVVMVI